MPPQRTFYGILGVDPAATPEEIKRQYRRLAKRYHPDLAGSGDPAAAQRAFVALTSAYEVLGDVRKRAAYDQELAVQRQRAEAASARGGSAPGGAAHASAESAPPRPGGRASAEALHAGPQSDSAHLLYEVRVEFAAGRLASALAGCQELLRRDRQNAEAHALLGDIYRTQGRYGDAARMYRVAVQLSALSEMGSRAGSNPAGRRRYWAARALLAVRSLHPVTLVGWLMVLGLLLLPAVYPGSPVASEFRPVDGWTDNLLLGMVGTGLLTGLLTGATRMIGRIEGDLQSPVLQRSGRHLPLGAVLLPASVVLFPAAIVLSLTLIGMESAASKPLMHVLAVSAGTLLLFALAVPAGGQTLLWGGNVIFPCMVLGSLAGGHLRDSW